MLMNDTSKEKEQLIEEMGVHFEQTHQMAPLAARIYALMILSSKDGHSFEEIVEDTGASKSSVSTQLNLLLQLKNVKYFTKSGDRKRYFRVNRFYFKIILEEYLKRISEEIKLRRKVCAFNSIHNKSKLEKNRQLMELFDNYLLFHKGNLEDTISKMDTIQNHP